MASGDMLEASAPFGVRRGPMQRLTLLLDLSNLLGREVELERLFEMACARTADALEADRASLWLVDAERGDLFTHTALGLDGGGLRLSLDRGLAGHVARTGELLRVDDVRADPRFDESADRETGYRTETMLAAPVRERADAPVRGVLQVLNRRGGAFSEEDGRYLQALALQLGQALVFTTLRSEVESERGVVRRGPINGVVGLSPAMAPVYARIERAAGTDATVMMRGETGTGKTLLARAVHHNSARAGGPFVTLDCTTLPGELVESELFGHERGAFTGAERRVQGRVEIAHGGTLFIDEIGELPLAAQAKLLRFVQERRFERVGGREPQSADVRIIAATHRDLEAMVAAGSFRQDLYYRLRVVEIEVPPLRARGADEIERLARHFAARFAREHDRPPIDLDRALLARLGAHAWPGNVRELEHWIESATVLSEGGRVPLSDVPSGRVTTRREPGAFVVREEMPLDELVGAYAEHVLARADGNKTEAARRLGISRNRLARILGGGAEREPD